MYLLTIHGLSTVARLSPGPVGIPTPVFGGVDPSSLSVSASVSAGTAALAGAGDIGVATGMAIMRSTTAAIITPEAEHSITATLTITVAPMAGGYNGHGGYNGVHGNTAAHYNGGNRPPGAGQHGSSVNGNRPPNAGYAGRGNVYNRPGANVRPFNGNTNAARGYAAPHGQTGTRSSAFSGYGHGGQARSYSSRGSGSFGGSHGGGEAEAEDFTVVVAGVDRMAAAVATTNSASLIRIDNRSYSPASDR